MAQSYIEFTRVQQVRVPIKKNIKVYQFKDYMNGDENMYDDDDIFDFDNEEIVEEEHSFANHDCKLVVDDKMVYEFKSPYVLGTLFKIK
jgi:hypothetical protein